MDILKSKMKIRKLLQHMHPEDIQRIINRVNSIREEKLQMQRSAEQELANKREAVSNIIDQMRKMGVGLDDLQKIAGDEAARPYKPRQRFLFRYETIDGSHTDWQGAIMGRIPATFSDYLKRTGKMRKDCIVTELS